MILIILFVLLICMLYIETARKLNYWKHRNIPFQKPLPFFGNFMNVALGRQQLGSALRQMYNKYDNSVPYFGIYIFHKPFLVIRSRELAKRILIKDFTVFQNRPLYFNEKIDPLAANALFILRGEGWRALRNKLSPIFSSIRMKMMMPLMKNVTDQMEDYLNSANGQEIDVRDLANRYSIDTICSCAFGINSETLNQKDSEMKIMANRMLDLKSLKRSFAIGAYFFCPLMVELFKLNFLDEKCSDFFIKLFKNSYEERRRLQVRRNDFIDLLHNLKEKEDDKDVFKFDDTKMSAQVLVFFTAGSETTVGTLSFCLYELAMNLTIQNKLRDEIRQNLDSTGSISYETLFEMSYLDLVIKETLRKYPLTHLLMRYAEREYTFEETGLHLESGTPVIISITALHYDERYFPDPDKFDPERFRGDKTKRLRYVYLPFGEGPRKCIDIDMSGRFSWARSPQDGVAPHGLPMTPCLDLVTTENDFIKFEKEVVGTDESPNMDETGDRFALMSLKIAVSMFLKNFEVTPNERTEIPVKQSKTAFFIIPDSGSIYLNVKRIA